MGSIYAFDLKESYFNDYSFRGGNRTSGLSAITHRSTLTNEAGGDSFTNEAAGTSQTLYGATLSIERTGFTLHEASTVLANGSFAGTSSYSGGFSETSEGEGSDSFTLGRTRIQNTKGATFSIYDENQTGVAVNVTGTLAGVGGYASFSVEKKFTAAGWVQGDSFQGWVSTLVPVTVRSVSWFTTYSNQLVTLSSMTVPGLHEVVSWQSVPSFDLKHTTSEFTSSQLSFTLDTAETRAFFEGRVQGSELWTANQFLGVNGERGLWVIRPPQTPALLNDALQAVGDWRWSKREAAGLPITEHRARWTGEGLATYSMDQLPVGPDSTTTHYTLEVRGAKTLRYHYVADGELKESSLVIPQILFSTITGESIEYTTRRVAATALATCPAIFITGDEFTRKTVAGVSLRSVATWSASVYQVGEYAYSKGRTSGQSVFVQAVEGASFDNKTSVQEEWNGQRTPKTWTERVGYGFVSEAAAQPVCFVQGRARGYLPFHFQGGEPGQLYREAGGNLLSTSGELTKVFGTGELAPCSDMVGEAGRSRLDPPCRCSSLTLEKINDASTVGIPFWSAVSYSTSRELWVVFESKLFKSTETFQRSSYQSGTTTAHPLETFTLHREWLPDTKTSAAARSFAFTVEGPNLLKKYGTIGVTLAGRVDPGGECWYSTQPQDSIIFASAKGILWWAGACLEATLVRGNGRPAMREATQAGEGARTIAFDGQAMRYQTTPMLALAPGGDLVYHNVTAAQDASHWPMFLIESATA